MKKITMEKSITINAPKENVWTVLFDDQFTRIWYAEFSEGTYAETDWQIGSKAVFKDKSNCGMVGKIIDNKPNEYLSIEYDGVIIENMEDYTSEHAMAIKGGRENYYLSEENEISKLTVIGDMSEGFFETMALAWDKALLKIKALSEAI